MFSEDFRDLPILKYEKCRPEDDVDSDESRATDGPSILLIKGTPVP